MKVFLKTFGCQMNEYDSQVALGFLKDANCEAVEREDEADVILFNTCSVREHAEDRVYGRLYRLRELKAERPDLIIGLLGCMVEEHKEKLFERFPHLDILCGTRNLKDLPLLVREVKETRKQTARIKQEGLGIEYSESTVRRSPIHAYLPVMTGCDKHCTYCIVPMTRGPEVSMGVREVHREAERLVSTGVKHITLLGQNVNSYGKNLVGKVASPETRSQENPSFARLLRILNDIDGLERISFTTSHPEDATRELFEAIRDSRKVSRRFHLALQSGSNAVLKRMKRGHAIENFQAQMMLLRELVPDISLTTDIITGFAGETEADHQATRKAIETLRFDGAYIFKYSERAGTPAAKLKDDVPFDVKVKRNQELLDLQSEITEQNNRALLGKREDVLVERPSTKDKTELLAHSSQDKKVVFSGDPSIIGKMVQVKLRSLVGDTFRGEFCINPPLKIRGVGGVMM